MLFPTWNPKMEHCLSSVGLEDLLKLYEQGLFKDREDGVDNRALSTQTRCFITRTACLIPNASNMPCSSL